ncbi:T9SS type A sorting domain-containing protein [bacterium]|nr:T9SS type A sorting domain-containing protein [bacterium]
MRAPWIMAGLLALLILLAASPARAIEARSETLWIFDADFEDLLGDNAGWVSEDLSGTLGSENYWHKDTIRINGFEWLGDSTWWCGTYNECWRQPRGYGNDWCQLMWRDIPLSEWSEAGDVVTLEWDQRIAMENDYDYGYVEVSSDGGSTWETAYTANNPGFAGKPGSSHDWDSTSFGHPFVYLSAFAGSDVRLRLRFESDSAYSSQDEYDNPPFHSVKDGAWQLDNIRWRVNDVTVWLDDCESAGDNEWQHPDIPAVGQTGVAFRRSLETAMGDPRWMMVAYDEGSGVMVDGQYSQLQSPAIDVGGAPYLVAEWYGWLDMPVCANDVLQVWCATGDVPECIDFWLWEPPTPYYGGPFAWMMQDDWGVFAGSDWLKTRFVAVNHEPEDSLGCHGVGFMLDRFRLGVALLTHVPDEPVFMAQLLAPTPNPFNPTTMIAYSVASPGRVTIRVYDLAGRVVRTLADGAHEAGEYDVLWEGRTDTDTRAASGVYFVRMTTAGDDVGRGNGVESRQQKLVLLK